MEHVRFVVPFQTVFYTPHYLALALGLFGREGIEAEQATAIAPNGASICTCLKTLSGMLMLFRSRMSSTAPK